MTVEIKQQMHKYNILVTNDDGIESPGLLAAVEAVIDLGNVTVIAPTHQQTAAGRGLTGNQESRLTPIKYQVNGTTIKAYHCDCSPALVVKHFLRTLFKGQKADLLVSGINYGENLGVNITSSGTVGAALEGAISGIPGIAVSKQTEVESHRQYTDQDWKTSIHFLKQFAKHMLEKNLLPDVDVLKTDVPGDATTSTHWKITKLAMAPYYSKVIMNPSSLSKISEGTTTITVDKDNLDPDSDIYAFAIDRLVSVTPISVDLTSRIKLSALKDQLA